MTCRCGAPTDPGQPRCRPCHAAYMRDWRKTHPQGNNPRLAARASARHQKRRGKLVPRPCAVCGDPNTEMHHVDYEKPIDVTWLCKVHHSAWHTFWRRGVIEMFEKWVAAQHQAMFRKESSPDVPGTTH